MAPPSSHQLILQLACKILDWLHDHAIDSASIDEPQRELDRILAAFPNVSRDLMFAALYEIAMTADRDRTRRMIVEAERRRKRREGH